MKKRITTILSLVLAGSLALSACQSAAETDDTTTTTTTTTTSTEEETEAPTDTEAPADSEEPADTEEPTDTEAPTDSDAGIPGLDPQANVPNANPELPLTDEAVTYTAMITYTLGKRDPNDMALYEQRAAETNVHIDYDYVLSTAVAERKATTLASGDFPDMFVDIVNAQDISTYGTAGQFLELTPYIESMPNLSYIFDSEQMVYKASLTTEGQLFGVPSPNYYSNWPGDGKYIRTSQVINKQWLDTLGLDMPETTAELVEVLTAFKEQDPNGNGEQDEIPYSFQYTSTWAENAGESMFGPFGLIGPGTHKSVVDGQVQYAVQQEGYVEAVQFISELYQAGLIDEEAFTQDAARYRAKGAAETPVYGMANGWTGDLEVGTDRVGMEVEGTVEYVPLPPLEGPNGERLWRNEYSGLGVNRTIFAADVENPELLMAYIDYLYAPDQSVQEVYGMFGHQTERVGDEGWQRIGAPEGWNVEEWLRDTTTRRMPAYISSDMAQNIISEPDADGNLRTKADDRKYQFSTVFADHAQELSDTMPPVQYTSDEQDLIGRIEPQITNAITAQEVLWMMGEGDVAAEYESFVASLETLAIDQVLDAYQSAVDRWNQG